MNTTTLGRATCSTPAVDKKHERQMYRRVLRVCNHVHVALVPRLGLYENYTHDTANDRYSLRSELAKAAQRVGHVICAISLTHGHFRGVRNKTSIL